MRTRVAALSLLFLGACGSSHPLWVEGDAAEWSVPLVDADGGPEVIVEAHLGDSGPHYFLVNPEDPFTLVDKTLAEELGLFTRQRWHTFTNQNGRLIQRRSFEVQGLRVGDLRFRTFGAMSFPEGAFDVRGYRIRGVLGGGVLSSTLVIGIDRDRQVLQLWRAGEQEIPAGATAIRGSMEDGSLYVPCSINGRSAELGVGLRHSTSVWPWVARDFELPGTEVDDTYVDPTGTARHRQKGVRLAELRLGRVELREQKAVVYSEKDWLRSSIRGQGILGADVLARYHVVIDRDKGTLWLAPRRASRPSARIGSRVRSGR